MYGRYTFKKVNLKLHFVMPRYASRRDIALGSNLLYQTARQRDQVLFAQANNFFDNGQYFQAAQAYAHCSATFEEVALKFLDVAERDSLRSYLISRLERTRKTVCLDPSETEQAKSPYLGSHSTHDACDLAGRILSE